MAASRDQDFDMLRRRINVSRFRHRVRWIRMEHAEDLGAAIRAIPRNAVRRTRCVERPAKLQRRARVFRPAVVKCQATDETFPTITPHDLHTAACLAISARANVKAVQRMLGHLFDEDLDGVADRLDAAIQTTADALLGGAKGIPRVNP